MRLDSYALQKRKVKIQANKELLEQRAWIKDSIVLALGSVPEQLELLLLFSADGERIRAEVKVSCAYQTKCDRCLSELIHQFEFERTMFYMPDLQTGSVRSLKELDQIDYEVEVIEDELDIGWYPSTGLEVEAVISEIFALEKPLQMHCHDDGLTRVEEGECFFVSAEMPAKANNTLAHLFNLE